MEKKEVSFLSANEKFQKSKYEESLKIINTVKTKDYDFYLLRAKIYFSINDFYLSLQDSNQCIKLQENNIEPYEIACKNYINMFDIESAKNLLEKMKTKFLSSSKEIKKIDNLINQKEKENEERKTRKK